MGTSVLVVEHNAVYLEGIASLIHSQPELTLAGTAQTPEMAIALYRRLRPELTLVDLDLPRGDGLEVIRQIRGIAPNAILIGLVTYELDTSAGAALAAGAAAIVAKDQVSETIPQLISSLLHR